MVRFNTRTSANYGATGSVPPPPPYSQWAPPSNEPPHSNPWLPQNLLSTLRKTAWWQTQWFVVFLTFILTVGLCMSTMPITYCDDPADPYVRERIRKEWNRELLEYEKQTVEREIVKARWRWEDEHHAALVREWEHERIRHERELKERARREEEERIRLNLFWDRVEAHQCKTYGTREYTAVLMNLPMDWKRRVEACRATPLEIHGIAHMPKSCEDRGSYGMIGRWEINQQEPECTPYWDAYNDKGCTSPGSGKKYITQHLMNVPENSDWLEFCATTPAHFNHMQYLGAPECISSIWGVYGQWEVDDSNC